MKKLIFAIMIFATIDPEVVVAQGKTHDICDEFTSFRQRYLGDPLHDSHLIKNAGDGAALKKEHFAFARFIVTDKFGHILKSNCGDIITLLDVRSSGQSVYLVGAHRGDVKILTNPISGNKFLILIDEIFPHQPSRKEIDAVADRHPDYEVIANEWKGDPRYQNVRRRD